MRQVQKPQSRYAKGNLQPMDPRMGMMMDPQQMQMQQSQAQQQGAFPQKSSMIPTSQPMDGGGAHQAFIQQALQQGYTPDMVMQFLSHKLNLK